jgi:hypothetical protein
LVRAAAAPNTIDNEADIRASDMTPGSSQHQKMKASELLNRTARESEQSCTEKLRVSRIEDPRQEHEWICLDNNAMKRRTVTGAVIETE